MQTSAAICVSMFISSGLLLAAAVLCVPLRGLLAFHPSEQALLLPFWKHLQDQLGWYIEQPVFMGLLPLLYYYVACIPWVVLDVIDPFWACRFQIRGQSRPVSTCGDWGHALGYTVQSVLIFVLPGMCWQVVTQGPWMYGSANELCLMNCNGRLLLPMYAPSVSEVCLHVSFCLVAFDAMFFVWHRLHHLNRSLYRRVHQVHHTYFAPFAFVTQYVHPCELFAVSLFSMVLPIAIGAHPLVQWIWLLVSVQLALDTHTGYDMPITLDKLVPFGIAAGPVHHDLHHQWPRTNFQPFFKYLDNLCGSQYIHKSDQIKA